MCAKCAHGVDRMPCMSYIRKRERTGGQPSWQVRWRFGGSRTGQWQSVTVRSHERAKTVRALLAAHGDGIHATDPRVHEIVTGVAVSPRVTFGEVARQYLDSRTGLRASTRDSYEWLLAHRLANWTDRPVASIKRDDVAALVNSLTDQGLSPLGTYDFAKSIFRYAVDHEPPLRVGNPAAGVKVKRNNRRPVAVFLTDHEAELLLASCDEVIAPMVAVTLATGLRFGEVTGLRVRDLELTGTRPSLTVAQAVRRPEGGNGYTLGEPKSASSRRVVVLDTHTVDLLGETVNDGRAADALVFPNPTGEHWRGSSFNVRWNRARDTAAAAGLAKRPRFHDLRHTHAAWLLTDGVPLLVVSRRLGHDSVAITASTYGHLHPDADDAVLASLARHRVSR